MEYTTLESEKKLCPLKVGDQRRGGGGYPGPRCEGSECAAWRWSDPMGPLQRTILADNPETEGEEPRPPSVPASWSFQPFEPGGDAPAQWVEPEADARRRALGFCGMAGTPVRLLFKVAELRL